MKIGDMVKLSGGPRGDTATGLIVERLADGYADGAIGVLWSCPEWDIWDGRVSWHHSAELRVIDENENR